LQDKKVLASRSSVAWQAGRQARSSQIFEFKQKERKDIILYCSSFAFVGMDIILFRLYCKMNEVRKKQTTTPHR
jgi:hypothetical protein